MSAPLARRSRILVALALVILCGFLETSGAQTAESAPARALWVVRTTLTSPASIEAMVAAAEAGGFNTLLVQVRGRGDAYYGGALEPRPAALSAQPASFDPLATTIARAHQAGLRVHAWVNVNLIASAIDPTQNRDHVIYRHPEWLMVPRAIAEVMARIDARSPDYLQHLVRYSKTRSDLEGLYLSPLTDASAAYTTSVVRSIVEQYPVDGIHLDYVRYPNDDFDYSREGLAAFRKSVVGDLPVEESRGYDRRLASEPLIYADALPDRWRAFRMAQLTRLVVAIRRELKAARPSASLSAAVIPNADEAVRHRLQDWPGWLTRGILDTVCPMAYTTDGTAFAAQISAAGAIAGPHAVWAGIGAYRLSRTEILANVQRAARLNVSGVVLFSYDSLASAPGGPANVANIGRAAFGRP